MQAGKNAVASAKETAANVAASAHAGMEKTKATLQEKTQKLTAHGPADKEMATERKQQLVEQAEINKQQARELHAAERERSRGGQTGVMKGQGTALHGSALPGHGTGQPAGGAVTEGVVESRPVGVQTSTGRTAALVNPNVDDDSDLLGFQGIGGAGYAA